MLIPSLRMELEGPAADLVGNDLEFPDFDPWGFSKDADEEKMFWYRAAELKHGRIAMLLRSWVRSHSTTFRLMILYSTRAISLSRLSSRC